MKAVPVSTYTQITTHTAGLLPSTALPILLSSPALFEKVEPGEEVSHPPPRVQNMHTRIPQTPPARLPS